MKAEIINKLLEILIPLIGAGITVLIGYISLLLHTKINALKIGIAREVLNIALGEAEKVIKDGIKATNQVLVDDLKKKNQDGKLTPEEQHEAIQMAMNYFLSHITKDSLSVLEKALGPVNEWLKDMIEAKIPEVKKEQVTNSVDPVIYRGNPMYPGLAE